MGKYARIVSWLDEAISRLPKKATPAQYEAALTKDPRVSMNEVRDRDLDLFFQEQPEGKSIPRSAIEEYLSTPGYEMSEGKFAAGPAEYQAYATPGMKKYNEYVASWPASESRRPSGHFNVPGYQSHQRSGFVETPQGNTFILDEVQSDVSQNMAARWDPNDLKEPVERPSLQGAIEPLKQLDRVLGDANSPFTQQQIYGSGYYPGELAGSFGEAQENLLAIRDWARDPDVDLPDEMWSWIEDAADQAEYMNLRTRDANKDINVPGRDRWQWQQMAKGLQRAVNEDADVFAWPSAQVQYDRYYTRPPESMPAGEAKRALGSAKMYINQYDRAMPREKRLKQLGLEPQLGPLVRRSTVTPDPQNEGDYWQIPLTPEIKQRLRETGIPFYGLGAGLLFDDEEEAVY